MKITALINYLNQLMENGYTEIFISDADNLQEFQVYGEHSFFHNGKEYQNRPASLVMLTDEEAEDEEFGRFYDGKKWVE